MDTVTDWKVGSLIVHRGEYRGKPYEDKGSVLKVRPPRLLVHSHWSALSRLPDSPENYQRVSWALQERDGETELTITEADLPSEQAKAVSEESWQTVLDGLNGCWRKAERSTSVAGRRMLGKMKNSVVHASIGRRD